MEHAATDPMNSDMATGGGYQNKCASKRERDKRKGQEKRVVRQVRGRDGEVGREMEEKEFCAELSWGWGSLCLALLLASRAV